MLASDLQREGANDLNISCGINVAPQLESSCLACTLLGLRCYRTHVASPGPCCTPISVFSSQPRGSSLQRPHPRQQPRSFVMDNNNSKDCLFLGLLVFVHNAVCARRTCGAHQGYILLTYPSIEALRQIWHFLMPCLRTKIVECCFLK